MAPPAVRLVRHAMKQMELPLIASSHNYASLKNKHLAESGQLGMLQPVAVRR